MPQHLGLNGQLPGGLGLARQRSQAGVTRETSASAPVVGVERTEIGSPADLAQRPAQAPAPAPAAKATGGVPQFDENPLAAIGLILQEVAAGIRGTGGPVAKANKLAIQQQSLKLRKDAQTLNAIKFGAEQLKGMSGDEADALIATVENVVPEAAEVLRAMAKAGAEKSQALLEMFTENPGMFPGATDMAQRLGAERTMELFGPIAAALAEQKALTPGRVAEAGAIAEIKAGVAAKSRRMVVGPGQRVIGEDGNVIFAAPAKPERPKRITLSPGQVLVDESGEVITQVAPKQATPKTVTVNPGQTVIDGNGNVIFEARGKLNLVTVSPGQSLVDETGKSIFTATPQPKGKAVNILLPDGKRATGRELPSGELKIVGDGGVLVSAPPGALKMTLQAAPGELPDAALNRKVVQIETTSRNFLRMGLETVNFLQNPKTVLGGAGASIRFAQGLMAQARQLAQAFSSDHFDGASGDSLTVAEILDPRRYNFDGMQAIAAANVRIKANVIAMAYVLARSRDPSGRLSDFDVQASMDTLGFQSNDKEIIAATIADRIREVMENSANFIEIATGKRPDLPTLPAALARASQRPKVFTIEELEELARESAR